MLQLVYLIVYCYLAISTLYILVLAITGNLAKGIHFTKSPLKKKIAVLIPAYREDAIILNTAAKAISHNYPGTFFQVIVIADSLQNETIEKLRDMQVLVLKVQFDQSTKAKSLHAALQEIKNDRFDIAMILDADNIMADSCLEKVNDAFQHSCLAIQCHRLAKNENTPIALLGAISEEININLFRRAPVALGLSAAPLGSGMAFEFELLKNIFETPGILDNTAEDREIEIQLMKRNIRLIFLNDLYVYDEKVAEAGSFEKQRTRWLEAQFNHIRRFFKPDMRAVPKTAVYYHTFLQNLLLPRLLHLFACGFLLIIIILQWLFKFSLIYPFYGWWLTWIAAYFVALLISVPARFYTAKTLKALAFIPVLFVSMLKAILKLKRNRKDFLHTSKTYSAK